MFKIVLLAVSSLLGVGLLVMVQPNRHVDPDPDLLRLAVRATVQSWPTPEPREVIVTQYIEVTRVVEVTRIVEEHTEDAVEVKTPEAPAGPASETSSQSTNESPVYPPTPEPVSVQPGAEAQPVAMAAQVAGVESATVEVAPDIVSPEPISEPTPEPTVEPPVEVAPTEAPAPIEAAQQREAVAGCPASSDRHYTTIPIEGGPADHPAHEHGDLNFGLRGSQSIGGHLGLVEINGPTDGQAPQLAGIFGDSRVPAFVETHQVFDWNWGCGGRGCRGELLGYPEVTLTVVQTRPGEHLGPARRGPEIYGGGFVALVLFAAEHSITLGYTREDSVANGYALHLNGICVDPNLLTAYQSANGSGRGMLPALRNGETLGTAAGARMDIAIRDRGMFKDPRSRKDWWQ